MLSTAFDTTSSPLLVRLRAPIPLLLPELVHNTLAKDGQALLLQLLLNDLPPSHLLGLVHRGLPLCIHLDVGQLRQLTRLQDGLVDRPSGRRLDENCEELPDVLDVEQLGVGNAVARQLVDALRDL